MREIRVYTEQALMVGADIDLDPGAARHVSQVLRMKQGQSLVLFDGHGGEYSATITAFSRSKVTAAVDSHSETERESPLEVTLWHGLCRAERMDTVVQKATELGVTRIQPVLCERSVVKLDEKRADKKLEHWRRVAISACEQSGRNRLPEILAPEKLTTLLQTSLPQTALLLHPDGGNAISSVIKGATNILLATGPEGGFSDSEVRAAQNAGLQTVTLGPRVLRTETAPLAALAVVQTLAGDLAS